jgi:FkbM family methyltransferase
MLVSNAEWRALLRLKKKLMNQDIQSSGKIKWQGFSIEFLNGGVVLNQIEELFIKKILRFKSDKSNPLIVDIGSNIGVSVLYFKSLYPESKIVAFEPAKEAFSLLEKNISNNKLKGVDLHNTAAWIENTTVDFNADGKQGGFVAAQSSNGNTKAISLKKWITSCDEIDMLKMDVEGAETLLLLDCDEVLKKVKFLYIEFHSLITEPQALNKLLEVLNKNGFRYRIAGCEWESPLVNSFPDEGFDFTLDIFATRVS